MAKKRLRADFFVYPNGETYKKAAANIPAPLKRKVYEKYGWTCQTCGARVRFGGLYDNPFDKTGTVCGSIDHILPVSRGGLHTLKNMRLLCRHCNCSRGADI